MKLIIGFLFVLQLVMSGIWGVNSLRAYHYRQLVFQDATTASIVFEDVAQYDAFLTLMSHLNVTVSRRIFTGFDQVILYSTDPTLSGTVTLSEGMFPAPGSQQFISNRSHNSDDQVGLIRDLIPDFQVMIRHLAQPENFDISGTYQLHTGDPHLIAEIESHLREHTSSYMLFPFFYSPDGIVSFLMGGLGASQTMTEWLFATLIPVITFICLIASLTQYSMNQIKKSMVLFVHGFTKTKIIKIGLTRLLATFLITGLLAYCFVIAYVLLSGFEVFFWSLTRYFLLMYSLLIATYLLFTLVALFVVLQAFNAPVAIKGFKPDFMVQFLNHGLKIVFTVSFLIASHFLIDHVIDLSIRNEDLSHWELAQGVYYIPITHIWDDRDLELDQINRTIQFFEELALHHQGFLMNSRWIYHYEAFGRTMSSISAIDDIPLEIHPFGNRVDITLNYLELNPIETVSGALVSELVIWDKSVLNILVPLHLSAYEDEIIRGYLEHFYNQSALFWDKGYSRETISELLPEEEGLSINIIYVERNQYYFTFNPHVRKEARNRVKDPIAVIFTGSFHDSKVMSTMTMALHFVTDETDAYHVIESILAAYDLTYHIRFVQSTFDHHGEVIAHLEGDIARSFLLMGGLLLTNVSVSYNLIANYFWRHKYVLFTKMLFGFSLMKRHQWFMLSFLGYLIPIIGVSSWIFGIQIFMMGGLSLTAELAMMLVFERRLMKRSFAEVMKGAH